MQIFTSFLFHVFKGNFLRLFIISFLHYFLILLWSLIQKRFIPWFSHRFLQCFLFYRFSDDRFQMTWDFSSLDLRSLPLSLVFYSLWYLLGTLSRLPQFIYQLLYLRCWLWHLELLRLKYLVYILGMLDQTLRFWVKVRIVELSSKFLVHLLSHLVIIRQLDSRSQMLETLFSPENILLHVTSLVKILRIDILLQTLCKLLLQHIGYCLYEPRVSHHLLVSIQSRLYGCRQHRPIQTPRHAHQGLFPVLNLLDHCVPWLLGVLMQHFDVLYLLG